MARERAASASAEKAIPVADTRVARNDQARKLTDPRAIRALAHPVRLTLLELLLREGPLTATQAGDLLDESPGNMSWHLQTLAKYGYVEEAGGGLGRARPWRLVAAGNRFGDDDADPEETQAAAALERLFFERSFAKVGEWMGERHTYPKPWRTAGFATDNLSYLTPGELEQLGEEIDELFNRFRERTIDKAKRPADARPVHIVGFGHPLAPTATGN